MRARDAVVALLMVAAAVPLAGCRADRTDAAPGPATEADTAGDALTGADPLADVRAQLDQIERELREDRAG